MDVSSHWDKLKSQSVDSFEGLQSFVNQEQWPDDTEHDGLVNELENALAETLCIQEAEEMEHASNGVNISNMDERNECGSSTTELGKSSQKLLLKSATFPCPNMTLPRHSSSGEKPENATKGLFSGDSPHNACTRSISLPTPSELVSAMKGSREKRGAPPKKLTVSWAPDVYDPTPNSMSHTVKGGKKQQKHKNNRKNWKKDGKKGQRGNSSRGKDKKQQRKPVGSSDRSSKPFDACVRIVEANNGFDDITVGSPDPQSYCGSSFLKKSLANMHYPVAEAL
ncbi:uncharacterized protein LOC107432829 [Ziziphus jujuba]|uniref:Uncharacterized protein LOC107432829 n=1 Tax=Ziziphus jujuba TaxID=326968 RepID=A0A6P4AS10_ZIZJJ|nr:uncharacterized protein LOC107432829 [Ziziphus jujuba]